MFIVVELEDYVCIHPQFFGNEVEATEIEISKKYSNKVIRNVGLVISLYSVDEIDTGLVYTGQGSCHSKVLSDKIPVLFQTKHSLTLIYVFVPVNL